VPRLLGEARRPAAGVGSAPVPRRTTRARPRAEAPELRLPGLRHRAALRSGQPVSTLPVWKGAAKDVGAGFIVDRYLTLPKGKAAKLQLTMTATEPLVAPVAKGQRVGAVKVALDGAPVADFPLVALATCRPPVSSDGRGTRCGCGSTDRTAPVPSAATAIDPRLPMNATSPTVYLNGEYLPLDEAKIPCSTAGSSSATACTNSSRCTGASRSAWRITSRGCSAASTAFASQSAHGGGVGGDHPQARLAAAVRRPGRLLPDYPRRGQARPRVSAGRAPTIFMMSNPLPTPSREQVERGVASSPLTTTAGSAAT